MFLLPGLALTLLVLGIGANHAHHTAPVDHFALVANLFYRCPDFHFSSLWTALFVAINNAPPRQVIRRKLDCHPISGQDAYKILTHLSGNVRQYLMLVLQFDAKHGVWQRFDDRRHYFNGILFRIARITRLFFLWRRPQTLFLLSRSLSVTKNFLLRRLAASKFADRLP
jgi:hypothetical protein